MIACAAAPVRKAWVTKPGPQRVPTELGDDVLVVPGLGGAAADCRMHRRPDRAVPPRLPFLRIDRNNGDRALIRGSAPRQTWLSNGGAVRSNRITPGRLAVSKAARPAPTGSVRTVGHWGARW